MHILVLLAIGAGLVFMARQTGAAVPTAIPPPPAPNVPPMPWAASFASGVSIGISGPDASAYKPNPSAGIAAAAPFTTGSYTPAPYVPFVDSNAAAADAAMGGASWDGNPAAVPTGSATPPGPTVEARRGVGHF